MFHSKDEKQKKEEAKLLIKIRYPNTIMFVVSLALNLMNYQQVSKGHARVSLSFIYHLAMHFSVA